MTYTKIISLLSKKTVAALFLLFCCVGNVSPKDIGYNPKSISSSDINKIYSPVFNNSDKTKSENSLTDKPDITVIALSIKNGVKQCKSTGHSSILANPNEPDDILIYENNTTSNILAKIKFKENKHFVISLIHSEKDPSIEDEGYETTFSEISEHSFPIKCLDEGITFYISKKNNNKLLWNKGINNHKDTPIYSSEMITPFLSLTACPSSKKSTLLFHIQGDENGNAWIKSNQILHSKTIGTSFKLQINEKHSFNKRYIGLDEIGILQKNGSFKLNPKKSTTQFSAEDIKKGMTFIQKNGQLEWRSGLIPFNELEETEEESSTEEVMNNYYHPEQSASLINYDLPAEGTPEKEASFFSSLSNNKATVICATTGLAIAAVLAHVLSGHNYLERTDSWALWSPGGLNALAIRALPQKVLLEKLHQEIAYRYGDGPDRIDQFLKDIKGEIHQLNLCYWSYNSLSGLYLLPKIQRFEEISQRIHLLKTFIYLIEQEMANKAIASLSK